MERTRIYWNNTIVTVINCAKDYLKKSSSTGAIDDRVVYAVENAKAHPGSNQLVAHCNLHVDCAPRGRHKPESLALRQTRPHALQLCGTRREVRLHSSRRMKKPLALKHYALWNASDSVHHWYIKKSWPMRITSRDWEAATQIAFSTCHPRVSAYSGSVQRKSTGKHLCFQRNL